MLHCDASTAESLAERVLSNTNTADTTIRQTANWMPTNPCYQFGKTHPAAKCRFKHAKCHKCKKVISLLAKCHIAKVCWSSQAGMMPHRQDETHSVHQIEQEDNSEMCTMYNLPGAKVDPIRVVVQIGDQELPMEVDIGTSLAIISEETYCFLA